MVYPALDGLRAIAFLMVFAEHYLQVPWGWTGVNIFFVLSGFLITGILVDTVDTPHRARNFYVRRTLRIFPLYYGIFLWLLVLNPLVHWHWSLAWVAWPLYVANFLRFRSPAASQIGDSQELSADAHLSSVRFPRSQLYLGHFWSLCVEEQFYLFWPWMVFWLRSRRALLWVCGVAVVAVPLLRVWAQYRAPFWMLNAELLYRLTPFQLDSLLLGGLVALLWRGPHRRYLLIFGRIVGPLGLVIAFAGVALVLYTSNSHFLGGFPYPAWKFTWGLVYVNFLTAALILCCLQPGNWLHGFLHLRPLRWLGRISYGAYVFHDIFHGLIVHLVVHHSAYPFTPQGDPTRATEVWSAALAFVVTLLISWLSFRFFESPFLNLKERWTVRTAS